MTNIKNAVSITQGKRRPFEAILKMLIIVCSALTVLIFLSIASYVFIKGIPSISWQFLSTKPSVLRGTIGILPSIINTLYIIVITILIVTPIGIGAAIYLNEYSKKGMLTKAIEFTTETLSGIPSIIYGLFGAIFFGETLRLGYSILTGALTLSIMVLPIIVRTTQEALKTVPYSYREGALGIGAAKWYMIRTIILPSSIPGIVTAVILSIGRIVAESAALIFTAGIATSLPKGLFSHIFKSGSTLSVELYQYAANRGDNNTAFGIAVVLIIVVLIINLLTKLISKKLGGGNA
ncbi:MAG: pstA [Oscillospiraceae bacterium]|nr:pstA [Oscillospiraceae bacterium]